MWDYLRHWPLSWGKWSQPESARILWRTVINMWRTSVELYGFAAHCAFMCLTQPATCEDCLSLAVSDVTDRIKLAVYWWCGIYTKSVYMNRYLLVRKAHNRRQKEMNATLVYRIFNRLRSKKCEYLSHFSLIFLLFSLILGYIWAVNWSDWQV